MTGFSVLLGKEMREQLRTYRLPVVAVVFVIFGITSPVLARYTKELIDLLGAQAAGGLQIVLPPPSVPDAVGQLIKNLGQFGILIAILLAMGTVASEKDRGTAAFVLTKPASRLAFLASKLVAVSVTLGVAVILGCLCGWLYTVLLFEGASVSIGGFALMAVLMWLAILAFAALTFLGSTVTSSVAGGAGFGFVALLVIGVLAALPVIGPWMPTSLTGAAGNLALGAPVDDVVPALIGTVLIIGGSFFISVWSFRRQEL